MSGAISKPTSLSYSFTAYRGKFLPSVFDAHLWGGGGGRKNWQEYEILSIKSPHFQICVSFDLRL